MAGRVGEGCLQDRREPWAPPPSLPLPSQGEGQHQKLAAEAAPTGFRKENNTMPDLLWQKPGVAVDARIQAFLAGDDVILDREFFLHDIAASRAHAEGLQHLGILDTDALDDIARELDALADDFRNGAFVLDDRFEDGHSAIEARLVERLGDTGRRIHTGRSRNDQVLVATRLWLKEKLAQAQSLCIETADIALQRARAEAGVPLPGYTHLQRAVVSSLGMWWGAWAGACIANAARARADHAWTDPHPPGRPAGYAGHGRT